MNQTGAQPLPPVQLSCHKHHELIKGVCLYHDSCNERLLCRVCRKYHDNNHLNSYEEFDDLLNGNLSIDLLRTLEEMTKRIEEQSQNSGQNVELLTAHVNGLFHEIQNYMVEKLVESRDKIFQDIQAKFSSNTNLKQRIRTCMEEVHKTYTMAANSGFKPLFVIENLIQVIRQAHIQKQRLLHDPEMNIIHTDNTVTGYLAALTSGSLFTQIQNSFEKLCEDIVESFVLRRKNEKSIPMPEVFQQEANRLFHGLAQTHQDANRGLQQGFTETMNLEDPQQGSLFAETASFLNKYNPLVNLESYQIPELSLKTPHNSVNYGALFSKQGLGLGLDKGEGKENQGNQPYDTAEAPYPSMQVEHEATKRSASPRHKHTPSNLLEMFLNVDKAFKSSQGKSASKSGENVEPKNLHDLFPSSQGERERQVSPNQGRRKDILEGQASISTSHKQMMFGGLAYLKQNLATAGQEGKIEIWDISKRQRIHTFQAHNGNIFRLLYVADKDLLVSSGGDGNINVWDCKKSFDILTTYTKLPGPVYALEYLSDLGMIASGGEDGQLRIWSIDNQKEFPPLKSADAKIGSLCYLRKLKKIAIGLESGKVLVAAVNSHTKKIVPEFTLDAHSKYVLNMGFVEDQSWLITGAEENIKIWRIYGESGSLLREFGDRKSALISFAIISEKDLILSNHADKFVRVWKISTGDKLTELADNSFGECIIGIKNKNKIITANHNEVKLWNLNS